MRRVEKLKNANGAADRSMRVATRLHVMLTTLLVATLAGGVSALLRADSEGGHAAPLREEARTSFRRGHAASSCGTAEERLTKLCGTATPPGNVCTVRSSVVLEPDWLKCEFALDGVLHLEQGASVTCANRTARCDACGRPLCRC